MHTIRVVSGLLMAVGVACAPSAKPSLVDAGPTVIDAAPVLDCSPNSNHCIGNDVYECSAAGLVGDLVRTCDDTGEACANGQCFDPCEAAALSRSYIGCEYWAVDLDNGLDIFPGVADPVDGCAEWAGHGVEQRSDLSVCFDGDDNTAGLCDVGGVCPSGFTCEVTAVCALDAKSAPFAIVVSNPQVYDVQVTMTNRAGDNITTTLVPTEVRSLFPQALGFPEQSIDGSGVSAAAYKIAASAPIVAYQFNPLDSIDTFSNDGSLLIPRTAYDTKYMAMTWQTNSRRPYSHDFNGYVSVVAWQDGTQVRVTPTADVRAGEMQLPIAAGTTATFTLDAFDVLNLEAAAGGDLTGSVVEAADQVATFGVFAGHEATAIRLTGSSCCADHIEEQMFPMSTWGSNYAIVRSESRGQDEPDIVRVLAQRDNTTVTFMPAPSEGTCPTLSVGEFCEVRISGDTDIRANQPVLVGHYLMSVSLGAVGTGDPALALAVPIEQYRPTYSFLTPQEYEEQYVSIAAPAGTTVTLDGVDVSDRLIPFGSGDYSGARIKVEPGPHNVNCPSSCGVEVYGYSRAVSYLFAAGLDLTPIVD